MTELMKLVDNMELSNEITNKIKEIIANLGKIMDVNSFSYWEENCWSDGTRKYVDINANTNHLGFVKEELEIIKNINPTCIELYTDTDGHDNIQIYLNIKIRLN